MFIQLIAFFPSKSSKTEFETSIKFNPILHPEEIQNKQNLIQNETRQTFVTKPNQTKPN
jgi:hypothetical protein